LDGGGYMKSNKSYVKSSLALQIVFIPVFLTLCLFIGISVFQGQLLPRNIGRDTSRFIYLLIAFFAPLLVGIVVGFVFKKNIRHTII